MTIAEAIQELAKRGSAEVYSTVCTVLEVDANERTCDVRPINGDADVFGVRLQANLAGTVGFVMLPTVGSVVVITWLNPTTGYVALMSEVDEVELHGSQYGGIVKVAELVDRLNLVEDDINELKQVLSGWTPVAQDGGLALKTAAATWYGQTLVNTQVSDIENDTVKHG
jgi:hypothetical protein